MIVKFIRHGETDLNNPVRRMQGISNYDINENGIKQAETTRDKLNNEEFDLIITSPLKRAMHTAQIINATKNIPIIIDKRIIERDYGQLEGKPFKREYCDLDFEFESLGGESIENYKIRLNDFIKDIKSKYDGKNILVVAHNGVISVLSCILEGIPEDNNFENRGIKNGDIKEFII